MHIIIDVGGVYYIYFIYGSLAQTADTTAVADNAFIKDGRRQTSPKCTIDIKDMQKVRHFINRIFKVKAHKKQGNKQGA